MTVEKSKGHLAFIGDFEYMSANGEISRARASDPIMTDGRRFGRFECYEHAWPMLKQILGMAP